MQIMGLQLVANHFLVRMIELISCDEPKDLKLWSDYFSVKNFN